MARTRALRRHHERRLKAIRRHYNNAGSCSSTHVGMVYHTPVRVVVGCVDISVKIMG